MAVKGAIGIYAPEVRSDGSGGRLFRQLLGGKEETGQGLVVILHLHIGLVVGLVWATIDPEIAFAILQHERAMVGVARGGNGLGAEAPANELISDETVRGSNK